MKTLDEVINEMGSKNKKLDIHLGLGIYTNNIISMISMYHRDNNISIKDLAKKIGVSHKCIKDLMSLDRTENLTIKQLELILKFFNVRLELVYNTGYVESRKNKIKWSCKNCENYKKNDKLSNEYDHEVFSCIKRNSHNKVIFDKCKFYKELNKK